MRHSRQAVRQKALAMFHRLLTGQNKSKQTATARRAERGICVAWPWIEQKAQYPSTGLPVDGIFTILDIRNPGECRRS
jgi:hypothetical protein